MYKKISLIFPIVALLFTANFAHAAVILQQTDDTAIKTITYQYGASVSQNFGTSLGGYTLYSVRFEGDSNPARRLQIYMSACQYSNCSGSNVRAWYPCVTPGTYTVGNCRDATDDTYGGYHNGSTVKKVFTWDFSHGAFDTWQANTSASGVPIPAGWYVTIGFLYENVGVSTVHHFYGSSSNVFAPGDASFSSGGTQSGSITDLYFYTYDVGGAPPLATQILTTNPPYVITPITSPVTLSGTYAIGPDLGSSTPNLLITLLDTDNGNYSEYNFGLVNTTPGTYSYSTTTGALADGRYHMSVLFDNSPNVYVATSSEFIVNKTITPLSSLSLYFPATSTPVTITTGLSDCDSMLTASGIGCAVGTVFKNVLYLLFIPDTYTRLRFQEQYNSFKYKAPWGYIFLVSKDITGYSTASTTSLSSGNLSITFPSNSNKLYNATSTSIWKGKTITFIDWTQMASSTTKNYWGSGWSSLNNMINLLLGAGFFFWLWKFASSKIRP